MAPKVTIIKLEADLNCADCCKAVKKALGKFSEIKDKVFDENSNTVTFKVVGSNPQKIMQKLSSKGARAIKSMEILPSIPKNSQATPKPEPVAPVPAPAATLAAVPGPSRPVARAGPSIKREDINSLPVRPRPEAMMPANTQGQITPISNGPSNVAQAQPYGRPNYDSWGGGPSYGAQAQSYGTPAYNGWGGGPNYGAQAQSYGTPVYDGWGSGSSNEIQAQSYERPVYESWGGGPSNEAQAQNYERPVYDSWGGGPSQGGFRSDYFSDENPQGCSIM